MSFPQVKVAVTEERQMNLDWERGRIFDKDVANFFLNLVKEQKRAKYVTKWHATTADF